MFSCWPCGFLVGPERDGPPVSQQRHGLFAVPERPRVLPRGLRALHSTLPRTWAPACATFKVPPGAGKGYASATHFPKGPARPRWDSNTGHCRTPNPRLGKRASTHPPHLPPRSRQAYIIFRTMGLRHMLVVNGHDLVGMITRKDLLGQHMEDCLEGRRSLRPTQLPSPPPPTYRETAGGPSGLPMSPTPTLLHSQAPKISGKAAGS